MELIRRYKVVIAIVLPIMILVLIRSLGTNHFKTDAVKLAEPSVQRSNIITLDKAVSLPGNKLFVNLVGKNSAIITPGMKSVIIPVDSILNKKVLRSLKNNNDPVLLYSTETDVSARVWMILSQMGLTNIYIVSDDPENEVMKNKFRPDTLIRPEL
jgi:hypothetical protein